MNAPRALRLLRATLAFLAAAPLASAAITATKDRVPTTPESAAALFAEQKFDEAADAFERLTALHPNDVAIRFNLARSLQEDGRLGLAILELERALRILPNHEPSAQLLERIRKEANAKAFTNTSTELLLRRLLPERKHTLNVLYASIALFGVAIGIASLTRRSTASIAPLALSLITASLAALDLHFKERVGHLAILIERNVDLQSAPVPKGNVLTVISTGSQLLLRHEHAGWILARLPDGTEGWIPAKSVRTIGNPASGSPTPPSNG